MSQANVLPETIEGLPNFCGQEQTIAKTVAEGAQVSAYAPAGHIDFGSIRAAACIALHMHQPLVPAGGDNLQTAAMIGNLQYMLEHQDIGDNHNAPVFRWCYKRMGEFIPELQNQGKNPRAMLDYSGTLFHGLVQIGAWDVIDALRGISQNVAAEFLGTPWGHAVAPSTPVADYRLHVLAWQHHFGAIFGLDALKRVRGFSPSEMALPNHPDVAYEFVKTLVDSGFKYVLVQEHTIEDASTGAAPQQKHFPHCLSVTNSRGESIKIIALIKTQGSDTKLVAQMQPYYEAQSLSRESFVGHNLPPLVTQIADGENGGVMMNEFPGKYMEVVHAASGSDVPLLNGAEYLEHLEAVGLGIDDFPVIQPIFQSRIWEKFKPGDGSKKLEQVIHTLQDQDSRFHMQGGSWTDDISWIRGYDNVLAPMEEVSVLFHEKAKNVDHSSAAYRNALYHLLISQTSCYRYWGQGLWTDYGVEICRRAKDILNYDL